MNWNVDLTGETALVIGGTKNIGLAVAQALQSAGAAVAVVGGSDQAALDNALDTLSKSGGEAIGFLKDMSEEAAVQSVFAEIEGKLGPVSVLVNSPGYRPHGPFADITLETWNAVLAIMLTGPFLAGREVVRRLPENRKGAIVNIGGLSAHRPAKDRAHVIAAKSGLAGLTRALAAEGQGRIRANCIVPGMIETTRKAGQPHAHFHGDEAFARGSVEDVARVVLAFSSPRDTYTTGQTVHVSDGRYMA
ncbi:MAG: SDR family oxidoreductase [Gammaproteobacteria bacterium]|nr:SDR family oxidoreductase [Gammaproteobacteria bacterium]